MNASQVAQLLNGRKSGRGKWVAKCPAHADRTPSLSIAEGRRVPVLLRCMSAGCDTRDILAAAGLTWGDLFDGKPSPELRRKLSMQDQKVAMERQLGLVIVLGAVEKGKRAYWAAAERRIRGELHVLRCSLEPDEVVREWREWMFQRKLQRVGWKGILDEFKAMDEAAKMEREYGIHGAGEGAR